MSEYGGYHSIGSRVVSMTVLFASFALTWMTPWASGPSPAVTPWLVTLALTGMVLWFQGWPRIPGSLAAWLVFAALMIVLQSRAGLGSTSLAVAAIGTLALGAGLGRAATNETSLVSAVAAAWLCAGLLSSVFGLCQYFGVDAQWGSWISHASRGEAFANLRQRNQFASLTNIALAALSMLMIRAERSALALGKWPVLAMAALLTVGNAASASRTGLIQLVLLCLLWWRSEWSPRSKALVAVAVGAYMVAALGLPWLAGFDLASHGVLMRLATGAPECASREVLWSNVVQLIGQRPWLGWGWGELDYAHFMAFYPNLRFCDILDNAHNLPLHLAVELGVPAAILICGWLIWGILRAKPGVAGDPVRHLGWCVLVVIFIHSMVEYPLWYGPFVLAFGFCLGLLWPAGVGDATIPVWGKSTVVRRCLAAALLGACTYAAWDYHRVSQLYLPPESRDPAYRMDTLDKVRHTWLFRRQVQFAELTTTALSRANAAQMFSMASEMLHYSPEPRVIEMLIESAITLGRVDEALLYSTRYRAAFPREYERWRQSAGIGLNLGQSAGPLSPP